MDAVSGGSNNSMGDAAASGMHTSMRGQQEVGRSALSSEQPSSEGPHVRTDVRSLLLQGDPLLDRGRHVGRCRRSLCIRCH